MIVCKIDCNREKAMNYFHMEETNTCKSDSTATNIILSFQVAAHDHSNNK